MEPLLSSTAFPLPKVTVLPRLLSPGTVTFPPQVPPGNPLLGMCLSGTSLLRVLRLPWMVDTCPFGFSHSLCLRPVWPRALGLALVRQGLMTQTPPCRPGGPSLMGKHMTCTTCCSCDFASLVPSSSGPGCEGSQLDGHLHLECSLCIT